MVAKPLPNLRKPSIAAAAAFVEGQPTPTPAPAKEVSRDKPKKAASEATTAAGERRRMTIYVSKANARALKLQSVDLERDMSDIVDDLLTKHLKGR